MQQHSITSLKPSPTPSGKGHALSPQALSPTPIQILDFGASHHMTHSPNLVTSLSESVTTQIVVGDSTQLSVTGSRTISLEGGSLQDVLLVPAISTNLLSVFQICHSSSGKIVEFSPHDVVIQDLRDPDLIVAIGSVDLQSHSYQFDGFESSDSTSVSLVTYVDTVINLWHENFGHVNYIYLQKMRTQELVIRFPQISCIDGVCQGCALGKHHKDPFPIGRATCAKAPYI